VSVDLYATHKPKEQIL